MTKIRLHKINRLLLGLALLMSFSTSAQNTINTTVGSTGYTGANNSGANGFITFVIENNSGGAILLTDVGNWSNNAQNGSTSTLYYSTTSLSGPVTNVGNVPSSPDWTSVASNTVAGLGATLQVNNVISGMNFLIPSGAQYRFALHTTSTNYYSGAAGPPSPNSFTVSGVSLHVGAYQINSMNVGYGVGNNPRWFTGSISWTAATPCAGIPVAGTAVSSASGVCPGASANLSLTGTTNGTGITYQWQQSPASANTWTNAPGTSTNSSYLASPTAATDYRAIVTCTNGGQSDISSTVSVTINPSYLCYCGPNTGVTLNNFATNYLTNVSIPTTTLNNTTTTQAPGAYSLFWPTTPSTTTTLTQGIQYTLNTTHAFTGYFSAAWIDFDGNGLFDASEFIDLITTGTNGTATFIVPLSATPGLTGMRVRHYWQTYTAGQACTASYDYETEDYVITIAATTPCSGIPTAGTASGPAGVCPSANFNLSLSGYTIGSGIVIQWQSSPAGANTWTAIPGANNPGYTVTGGQTAATDYRAIITCTNGGQTDISNTVAVALNPPTACYCIPTYTNGGGGDNIVNVTLGVLNNSTTGNVAPYYTNYTTQQPGTLPIPDMVQGITYNLSISFGTDPNQYHGVWIDYDQDGIFTTTEFISTMTNTGGSGTVIVPLNIPLTALPGNTRMRIRGGDDSQPQATQACGASSSTYGEAEDYLVNIVATTACSGQPTAGIASGPSGACAATSFTLTLVGNTLGTGIVIQWEQSPAGANIWSAIPSANGNTHTVTNQTSATDYRAVVTCTNGGLTDISNVVAVAQNPPTTCYCTPTYTNGGANDYIANVQLGSLAHNTGALANPAPFYRNYTTLQPTTLSIPDLAQGLNHTLSVTYGPDGSQYEGVWIDFDQNGVFDASEYFTSGVNAGGNGTNNITLAIPVTATLGNTRMRIRGANDGSAPTSAQACGATNSTYGEAEDYLVNIIAAPSCLPPTGLNAAGVLTNGGPITWTASTSTPANGYEWRVFPLGTGPNGIATASGTVPTGTTANVTGLNPASDYTFYVRAVCSPTDTSVWASINFTTTCATVVGQYTQEFNTNATPNCWTNSGPEQWLFSNGAGPGYGVAGSTDHTGNSGYFAWVDGSGTGTNQNITLTSVPVDITGFPQPTLSYYMKSFNNSDGALNKLIVEVLDGSNWIQIDSVQMNYPTNAWYNRQVSLAGLTSSVIQVRFVVDESNVGGSAFNNDLLLDDVQILANPLAIELMDIKATNVVSRNQIIWVTGTDDLGDKFEVERSSDSRNFTYLGTVNAVGGGATYNFWDEMPLTGVNYYRLKMVDVNGHFDYSRMVTATVKGGAFAVHAYPNPTSDILHVAVTTTKGNATVSVSDVTGKNIKIVSVADNKAEINMSGLAAGVYLIKYSDAQRTETIKINKQ